MSSGIGCGLDSQSLISGSGRDFSLHYHFHTGSEACPAFFLMGTGDLFPLGEVARS
jgi:hypothetical protein